MTKKIYFLSSKNETTNGKFYLCHLIHYIFRFKKFKKKAMDNRTRKLFKTFNFAERHEKLGSNR